MLWSPRPAARRRDARDADAFSRALPILHRRGIRYMTLQGGEPLDRTGYPGSDACMMACYRNASMLMHAAIAATDAARALAAGKIGAAAALFRRSVAQSVWALIEETPKMRRLARRRKQTAAAPAVSPDGHGVNCKGEAS